MVGVGFAGSKSPLEHIGIEIRSIRLDNGADVGVGGDLGENVIVISDLFEHGTPQVGSQIYDTLGSVGEPKAHDSIVKDLNLNDVDYRYSYGNGSMVPGGLVVDSPFPAVGELAGVQSGPLLMATQVNSSESPNPYKVQLSNEDGIWLIEAVELKGVRSFGTTVSDAARNIREAIAAAKDLDVWDDLDLEFDFDDDSVSSVMRRFREATRAEEQASAERDYALTAAITPLQASGMSYRDIGVVIGLSHQRVAQLVSRSRV